MCGGAATSHASQSGFAPVRGADIIAVTFVSGPRIIGAPRTQGYRRAGTPAVAQAEPQSPAEPQLLAASEPLPLAPQMHRR
jgi:hypothetical protein